MAATPTPYDRINVCAFGAVPNDGLDDTIAINNAINAVLPTPTPGFTPTKSIYFPAGTYVYDGPMALQANTAYRLYGDGPGVSTIIFTGSNPGINANAVGDKTLQIEGLTLEAGSSGCGASGVRAIYANFSGPGLFKTATIRNLEIRGSERTENPTFYWSNGISLSLAGNTVIEDVQVHGKYAFNNGAQEPASVVGIEWKGGTNDAATCAFLHNIYLKYFQTGISTSGWVESFRLSDFEIFFCGSLGSHAAMELMGATGGQNPGGAVPLFHISDGHINQISSGMRLSNTNGARISDVDFLNQLYDGTHLQLTNCSDVNLVNNHFSNNIDHNSGQTVSNGIYVISAAPGSSSGIIMSGNSFAHMYVGNIVNGSCIAIQQPATAVKILDTLFGATELAHKYATSGADVYIRDFP